MAKSPVSITPKENQLFITEMNLYAVELNYFETTAKTQKKMALLLRSSVPRSYKEQHP
jgi:uncharacterized protein involved in propanediol utilization